MKRIQCLLILVVGSYLALGQVEQSKPVLAKESTGYVAQRKPRNAVLILSERIPEIRFDDTPLDQAIESLAGLARTNIVVQWRRLEEYGIKRDTPITLNIRNLRLSQVLWLIMNQSPLSEAKLAYRADSDMILLSTDDDLGQEMLVRVYDVQELLQSRLARPTFLASKQREIVETVVPTVGAGAVGVRPVTRNYGSGVEVIGQDDGGDTRDPLDEGGGGGATGEEDNARELRLQRLVTVITNTVEPDEWTANGGRCSIVPWRGNLVVRATPKVHQALGGAIQDSR